MVQLHHHVEKTLNALGFKGEGRRYRPHLTIGRVRSLPNGSGDLRELIEQHAEYEAGLMIVDQLTLYSSELEKHGPVYAPLGYAELKDKQHVVCPGEICAATLGVANSMLGLVVGGLGLLTGGRVQRIRYTLEFSGGAVTWLLQRSLLGQSILAMTLGHVILGVSSDAWPAHVVTSGCMSVNMNAGGRSFCQHMQRVRSWFGYVAGAPYRDNWFEVQAYAEADCD